MISLCSLAKGQSIEGRIIKVDGDKIYISLHHPNVNVSDVVSVYSIDESNTEALALIEITVIPGAYSVGKVVSDISTPLVEKMIVRKDGNSLTDNINTKAPVKTEIVPQQQEIYSPPVNQRAPEPVNQVETPVQQEKDSQTANNYTQMYPKTGTNNNILVNGDTTKVTVTSSYDSFVTDSIAKNLSAIEGKAIVYIIRPSLLGALVRIGVVCDDQPLGSTMAKQYIFAILDPGKHTFSAHTENKASLDIILEAGKIYYIKQKVKMGLVVARVGLELMSESDGRKALNSLKLSSDNLQSNTQ